MGSWKHLKVNVGLLAKLPLSSSQLTVISLLFYPVPKIFLTKSDVKQSQCILSDNCAQLALKAFERVEADRVLEASTQDRGSRCSPTLTYFCRWAVHRVIRPSTETRYGCDNAAAAS